MRTLPRQCALPPPSACLPLFGDVHCDGRPCSFTLALSQHRWAYAVRLLQYQYVEGLLDEPELFRWLLAEFRCAPTASSAEPRGHVRRGVAECAISTIAPRLRCNRITFDRAAGPEALLFVLPLVLDLTPEMCQSASLARYCHQ